MNATCDSKEEEEDESFLLRIVETCAKDQDAMWDLLCTQDGRNRVAMALSSRAVARAVREKSGYQDDILDIETDGVQFSSGDLEKATHLLLQTKPMMVIEIFARAKRKRAVTAMALYVGLLVSRRMNVDDIAFRGERIAWLVGTRIAMKKDRQKKRVLFERLFLYLGSMMATLGETKDATENFPHAERALAGFRQLESVISEKLATELGKTERHTIVVNHHHLQVDTSSVGILSLQLSSAIRSVLRDEKSIDPKDAGADLAKALLQRWSIAAQTRSAIHLARFIMVSVARDQKLGDDTMKLSLRPIRSWSASLRLLLSLPSQQQQPESRMVLLAKHMIAEAEGNFVLMIGPSTTPENISQSILQKGASKLWMTSLCGTKTYDAVPGRKDLLKDRKDGSFVRITKRGRSSSSSSSSGSGGHLKVFYASVLE